jgi:hypothetical protein
MTVLRSLTVLGVVVVTMAVAALLLNCGRGNGPTAPDTTNDKVILEPPDSTSGAAQPEIPKYVLIDDEMDTTRGP